MSLHWHTVSSDAEKRLTRHQAGFFCLQGRYTGMYKCRGMQEAGTNRSGQVQYLNCKSPPVFMQLYCITTGGLMLV
jgi:hypothetical protein